MPGSCDATVSKKFHKCSFSYLFLFYFPFPRSCLPFVHSWDTFLWRNIKRQDEPKTLILSVEIACKTLIFSLSWSSHISLLSSDIFSLSVRMDGGTRKREEEAEEEREGVDVLFSSAECAHMYERRSIYFRTLAWVYTDLKYTHTHTLGGSEPRDRPDLPLYQSCFESCWKDAFPL